MKNPVGRGFQRWNPQRMPTVMKRIAKTRNHWFRNSRLIPSRSGLYEEEAVIPAALRFSTTMRSIELTRNAIIQFDFATDRGKELPIHRSKAISSLLVATPQMCLASDPRRAQKIPASSVGDIEESGHLAGIASWPRGSSSVSGNPDQ